MKNIKIIFGLLIFFRVFNLNAQQDSHAEAQASAASFAGAGWLNKSNLCRSGAFIQNKGQFNDIAGAKNKGILYQLEDGNMQVSFTPKGLVYVLFKNEKASEREWEEYSEKNHSDLSKEEEREKNEGKKDHYIPKISVVEMNWNGANSAIEVVPENPTSNYFNYYFPLVDKDRVIGNVQGFKKITYKNVYPFIDVEYTIHPTEGIKYSYIMYPGANPSLISMGYTGANIKLDNKGNLQFTTEQGNNIIDHAPLTYKGNQLPGGIIDSKFKLIDKNTVGFTLANGITNISETTVIDPWQVGTPFPVSGYTPNDLDVDGSGNILVYSFKPPSPFSTVQRIDKYSSAGVLIWTFNLSTNASYSGGGQGDVKADAAGNVYASIGLGATATTYYNTIKINPGGTALIWGTATGSQGSNNMYETWTITFNCNYTQFYQSGGGRVIGGTTYYNVSVEEPVNAATGVEGTLIQNDTLGDIYCTYYSPDGFVYHMTTDSNVTPDLAGASVAATTGTHNNLVCFNPTTGARLFRVQLGNSYSYVDGDVKAPGSIGMNAMVSSCQYLYTMSGNKLDRWNPLTGAHYNQITIPGGVGGSANTGKINSGILTDKCGNVYVGSNGNIYVYDPNLSLINTIGGFPGVIFDLAWTNAANTDIVACGGISNTTTFLKDVAVTACILPNTVTVTPTQPTCTTAATATAIASFCGAPYSYSWSNGQTTQVATNLAPGTYTVTVSSSITCPYSYVETQTVTINPAPGSPTVTVTSASVCPGSAATITASGATTYSWSTGATTNTITANPIATTSYTVTGTTAGCIGTAVGTITVVPNPTVTATSTSVCATSAGTITASGATTYSWNTGATTNTISDNPALTTSYTVTGTTASCTASAVGTITVVPNPTVSVNSPTICVNASTALNASGATTYVWTPATGLSATTGASVTANPSVTTSYTVTGTSATCTSTAVAIVTVNPTPTITVNSATICPTTSATLTANGASTYTWAPSATLSSATGTTVTASPGATTTYTITGTSVAGCTSTATSTVTIGGSITPTVNNATICAGSTATLTAGGATTYTWSPAIGLSGTSGASVTASPTVNTTYTITGATGACTGTVTSLVTINPLPTVTVNSSTICIGQTATLTAGGASTFTWAPSATLSSPNGSPVTATPVSTTSYTVTGTDANGCVNSNTTAVTVNPLPTITVASTTICPSSTGTLTAGGALTYTWNTGAMGSSITDSPVATTSYTVIGTDINGCTSGNTGTITVNSNLSVIANNNSPICSGATLTLTVSAGTSWNWTGPLGYTSNVQNPSIPNATGGMSGTYSVTAIDANGCQGSAVTTVTVNPLPVITVGSNSPLCVNQTLSLTATGGPGYSWSGPNGFSSTVQNPTITGITGAGGGTYFLIVTDIVNSCVSTATLAVVVNPLPNITATGANVCVGANFNLGSNGGVVYSWSGPNAFSSNQQNPPFVNADATMAGNYVVTASNPNGCANAAIAVVTVNNPPSISVNSGTICQGKSIILNALGANTYSWTPSTGLNSTVGSSIIASPATTTSYTIVGTDLNGCSNTAISSVTVIPVIALNITPPITTGCAPVCVSFTNTTAATGTCNWVFGDGTTSANCAPAHCFAGQGTFFAALTVTDANGCTNKDSAKIVVYPMPHADFSSDPQPTTILDPIINFHNLSSGAIITTLGWTFGDPSHVTSTAANPTHTYLEAGTYPAQLVTTTNFGCKDSITKYIVISEEFMIYVPNAFSPNGDGINDIFYAKGEGIKSFKMYIFDRWGEQVFSSDDIFKGWDGRFHSKGTEIVQEDLYVWKIELKAVTGQSKTLKGTVSLIK